MPSLMASSDAATSARDESDTSISLADGDGPVMEAFEVEEPSGTPMLADAAEPMPRDLRKYHLLSEVCCAILLATSIAMVVAFGALHHVISIGGCVILGFWLKPAAFKDGGSLRSACNRDTALMTCVGCCCCTLFLDTVALVKEIHTIENSASTPRSVAYTVATAAMVLTNAGTIVCLTRVRRLLHAHDY
eukprot:gene18272-28165_t